MTQTHAEERGRIAALRAGIRAAAEDPPQHGYKLMMAAEDVAAIMPAHVTPETVRDKHRGWTEKNGFPAPIPGMSPLVWSGPQLMAWLKGPPPQVEITGTPQLPVSELERKYGGAR